MWDIRKPRAKSAEDQNKRYAIPEQSFEPVIRTGEGGKGTTREPERSETDNRLNIKVDIHRELLERVNLALIDRFSREELARELGPVIDEIIAERSLALNRYEKADLVDEILDELVGLGPLEPLLKDETISDILVNGSETVFVERRGVLERAPTRFKDEKHLLRIIQKIVSAVGRRVDEASPFVDARLADGSRVNAIIAPLAIDGSLLSIRKFSKTPISMERMVEFESLTEEMAMLLQAVVQGRLNIIISGGTGSGKTTMLNALSSYINGHERIVTIEDSAELQLQQEHVARLETRPANIEGRGEVNQRDLVRNALRMRPDRIVLGECRSGEAFDMLQAMNTGHDGSMTTVHANTARDALARIEQMVGMAGLEMSMRTIRSQIVSAINVVIQVGRLPDGRRKTLSISEVTGMEGEVISMQEIFRFRQSGRDSDGRVLGQFEATGVRPHFAGVLKSMGIYLDPELFKPPMGYGR
ncbi:CpaF family protein [Novosphingobium taihuense]|uniref:Pilus assembly protein CpaF n=1 Tax=Novosphingobium taihuense TaxID=260085 RepID=A0A7W7AEQ9_9SPHN|nr:CpaF family protein [Novosphingobium taihuense]MBB4615653.1 pilus assembly protein CpaF [Novosphingobium taihuense]TWH79585.1 pilus assembly protein CpaF [Novosphingobium taihuense]